MRSIVGNSMLLSGAVALASLSVACGGDKTPTYVFAPDDGGDALGDAVADGASDVVVDAPVDAPDPGASVPTCASPDAGVGSSAPAPRGDHVGALDPSGKQLLVFGGDTASAVCGDPPAHTHVGDTWLLDVGCGSFREVTASANPGARARMSMATDVAGHRAILFGGRTRSGTSGPYTELGDVWAFDFTSETWSAFSPTGTAPTPRSNSALVISQKLSKAYVFGGNVSTSGTAFTPRNDTFSFDLKTSEWKAVAESSSTKPPARLFHAMAIDDDAGVLYVYGGGDENAFTGPFLDDVWALDLKTEAWTLVATSGDVPQSRILHSMVYDSGKKRLVVFGGHDDGQIGNQNDVWTLDPKATPATWKKLSLGDAFNKASTKSCNFPADFTTIDKASPERRESFALGARPDGRGFVIYGGKSDCGLVADAWWFNGASEQWSPVVKSPVGLSCLRYSTTCAGLCG